VGQWILYASYESGSVGQVEEFTYAAAHDGAGDSAGQHSSINVGQYYNGVSPYRYGVYRGCLMFRTSQMPGATSVSTAKLYIQQYSGSLPTDSITLMLVSGADLQDPLAWGDFLELLDDTVGRGFIVIPSTPGLWDGEHHLLTLNATGISDLSFVADTWFGIRTTEDINNIAPDLGDLNYISITFPSAANIAKLLQNENAARNGNTVYFSVKASENDLSYGDLMPKLVLDVVASGNYTNLEIRFQYGNASVSSYSTDWQSVSDFYTAVVALVDAPITISESTMWRAQIRFVDDSITGSGATQTGGFGQLYPSEAITRVTNLVHRYNRELGVFTLEQSLGSVTSDFGMPDWPGRPVSAIRAGQDMTSSEVERIVSDYIKNLYASTPMTPPFDLLRNPLMSPMTREQLPQNILDLLSKPEPPPEYKPPNIQPWGPR